MVTQKFTRNRRTKFHQEKNNLKHQSLSRFELQLKQMDSRPNLNPFYTKISRQKLLSKL